MLILAQSMAIQFDDTYRFQKACEYFELSIKAQKNKDNLFAFGYFLQEHKQNNRATPFYEEALAIRRKLAKVNPQTYLPDVAGTLNNLAILQDAKNEFSKAEQSYEEALNIRKHFAQLLPEAFEIPLAHTYLCLSNLYRYNIVKKELSKQYAQKAVALYQKYWNIVPYARKWGEIAKNNLNY